MALPNPPPPSPPATSVFHWPVSNARGCFMLPKCCWHNLELKLNHLKFATQILLFKFYLSILVTAKTTLVLILRFSIKNLYFHLVTDRPTNPEWDVRWKKIWSLHEWMNVYFSSFKTIIMRTTWMVLQWARGHRISFYW